MLVAKMVGAVAAILALGLTWSAVRAAAGRAWPAAEACGFCVLQFLMFRNLTFWSRPEPLQLVAVAAGLFAAARLTGMSAVVVTSLSAGLLWNLKITGPLYSLPIFALFYARSDLRHVVAATLGAGVVAVLPFLLFNQVSWSDYMLWVQLSARNGLRVAALKENLEWALFLLIPVLLRLTVPTAFAPSAKLMVPALLIGVCGVVVAASKPGAGAYHLVPFVPVIAYVYSASDPRQRTPFDRTWQTPFAATLMFVVLIQQQYFFRLTLDPALNDSYRDVAEYLARHPGERVAMGTCRPSE